MPKWLSTAGNQFNSWGFPQVPYSGPGLCQTTVEGPLSYFSNFAYRRSSHRRKSAACHLIDIVWLYCISLAYPSGGRGIFYKFKRFLPAFAALRGEGVSTRWDYLIQPPQDMSTMRELSPFLSCFTERSFKGTV